MTLLLAPELFAGDGIATTASPGSPLKMNGGVVSIPADLGILKAGLGGKGGNLFHSFDQFNVPKNVTAEFSGPAGIANILARVTGKDASQIDGTIRSAVDGANLYLMNPNGILFGAGAKLDIRGSFAATTADSILFEDNTRFTATVGGGVQITAASPKAFGFSRRTGDLHLNQAELRVPDGKGLQLVGANVALANDSKVVASGGSVVVVAQAGPADVSMAAPLEGLPPSEGAVTLDGQSSITADSTAENGRGEIQIRAGRLVALSNNSKVAASGGSVVVVAQAGPGDVSMAAPLEGLPPSEGAVTLDGQSSITADSTAENGPGRIQIRTGRLILVEDQQGLSNSGAGTGEQPTRITANSYGETKAGEIQVVADVVQLTGKGNPSIRVESGGAGDAGTISITANTLTLDGDPNLSYRPKLSASVDDGKRNEINSADGNAGEIHLNIGGNIEVQESLVVAYAYGTGGGGVIEIKAKDISIRDSWVAAGAWKHTSPVKSRLSVDSEDSVRVSGNVLMGAMVFDLRAVNTVTLEGPSALNAPVKDAPSTWIGSAVESGVAGNTTITCGDLIMSGASAIGAYVANPGPDNRGGDIRITTSGDFSILGDYFINTNPEIDGTPRELTYVSTSVKREGTAGNIDISVGGNLLVGRHARITSEKIEAGSGRAGAINILAKSVRMEDGGLISVKAAEGTGTAGVIDIRVRESLDIVDSAIRASGKTPAAAGTGSGRGGISLAARNIFMKNAEVLAVTPGLDADDVGGNIDIPNAGGGSWPSGTVPSSVVLIGSVLRAESQGPHAESGNIRIESPGYLKTSDTTITATHEPTTPEFEFQPPIKPPQFQLTYEAGTRWEAPSRTELVDPEGYTQIGSRSIRDDAKRRRIQLGL